MAGQAILKARGITKHFPIRHGLFRRTTGHVQAVDGVDFDLFPGETLGLVGESGSGKSTTARLILRLLPASSGTVHFDGENILAVPFRRLRRLRREMQIVFQDPYASLDPRMPVGAIVEEPLTIHRIAGRRERKRRVEELLERVGLGADAASRFPHEFSGGERQRIGLARALALRPRLIVCDEPVSALDVSIRAQILGLLAELQEELGLTYLFISHDLSVVRHVSDRIAVMYLGKIVEIAPNASLYGSPHHSYTQALLSAVPVPDPDTEAKRKHLVLKGDIPSPADPPSGCRFRTRCPRAEDICSEIEPELREVGPNHRAACHFARPHPLESGGTGRSGLGPNI